MRPTIALFVVALAACASARPPEVTRSPMLHLQPIDPQRERIVELDKQRVLFPWVLFQPRGYKGISRQTSPRHIDNDWLSKEIARINNMEEIDDPVNNFDINIPHWSIQNNGLNLAYSENDDKHIPYVPMTRPKEYMREPLYTAQENLEVIPEETISEKGEAVQELFALTPLDKGYYNQESTHNPAITKTTGVMNTTAPVQLEPPRQIRQNPNLSRSKSLLHEDLDKLRVGFTPDTVSGTDKIRLSEVDPANYIYGVALVAAVSAALAIVIIGFGFGWYTLSKKAKAAADVDYPAYGVTGPTIDTSGDRKLAHSAHMYHYQHQKQQIIAMERNGLDQGAGSISDPESEEDNEEGDYTVYECPGFATTGDMEVKNPMFSDDPTPATPGKCEVVKPQPKN